MVLGSYTDLSGSLVAAWPGPCTPSITMTAMTMDDLVPGLQHLLARLIRRLRLGPAPARKGRRLLIVQIDGLSREVLDLGLARGDAPFLAHLLERHGHRLQSMCVGMPTSTPAFQ